jgi:glycosyltransferase involved in cell wall biosynthesis
VNAPGLSHWTVPLHTSAEFSPQVNQAAQQLIDQAGKESIDVIHAHTRVSQIVADRVSKQLRVPYVTTRHGFFRPNLGRRLWPCTGEIAIAISEPVVKHLITDFSMPVQRVRLIMHGVDVASFEAPVDEAARQALRAQLAIAPGRKIIGTVARLVPSKSVDQLIQAMPRIRATAPEVTALVIGDGEDRARLERMAQELGVAEDVKFAGTVADTRAALSLMDVFVFLPAEQEGFGLSLLEAMAARKPIVAIRQGGGAPWVLDQVKIGQLVAPKDLAGLAEAVVRYLRDPDACRAAGERAHAVAAERYSMSRMVTEVEAVYKDVATRENASSTP